MSSERILSFRVWEMQCSTKPSDFPVARTYEGMRCCIETVAQIVILPKYSPIVLFFVCCDFVELQIDGWSIFFLRFLVYKRKRHRVRIEHPIGHQPILHIVMACYGNELPPLLRIAF